MNNQFVTDFLVKSGMITAEKMSKVFMKFTWMDKDCLANWAKWTEACKYFLMAMKLFQELFSESD